MSALTFTGDFARRAVRRLVRVYYPTVKVSGRENIPASGPVLFVANHPNSMLDPAMIGIAAQRPVHFFAKAPLFDVPVFGGLMRALGMVPAFRGMDDRAQVKRNLESLEAGAVYLARGEAVGIFPEGKSHDLARVEQVRTGAARMALEAVRKGAGVRVVPLGLNYERKDRFRSAVWVRVGGPIDAAALAREHGEDERKAMRALTAEIDRRLKDAVVHLDEEKWEPFLHELAVLLPPATADASDPIATLRQRKRIADAMNHFLLTDRPRAEAMAGEIERYRTELAGVGLTIDSALLRLRGVRLWAHLKLLGLWLVLGCVPALAGAVHHLVPFALTRGLTRLVKLPGRVTVAFNRLLIGLPLYAAWYALVWWALGRWTQPWIAWTWTALMPLAGIMSLHYAWQLRHTGRVWREELRMLFRPGALRRLRGEQDGLRGRLEAFRQQYAATRPPDDQA